MKHYKTITKTRSYEKIDTISCDRCGKDITIPDAGEDWERPLITGVSFRMVFGYGSRYDQQTRYYDVCDDCCDWLDLQLKPTSDG